MKGHEPWEELAAGYALNALEPEDEDKFSAHVRGCDPCRRALEDMRAVVGQLAYAVEPAEPPAALHDRIMAALPDTGRPAFFPSDEVAVRRARRRFPVTSPGLQRAVAAAAVVALVALGSWNLRLRETSDVAAREAAQLRAMVTAMSTTGATRAELVSASGVRGAFFVSAGKAWLVVDGLEPNDTSSSQYVVWWQDPGGALHALAPFDVPSGDPVVRELRLEVPVADVRALAISKEAGRVPPPQPAQGAIAQARVAAA